jgi:hypothetical protein
MPRPFRDQITCKSTVQELIRADKSQYIRTLYARLGPEKFYRRRLQWLRDTGKQVSCDRLIAFLKPRRIEISDPL